MSSCVFCKHYVDGTLKIYKYDICTHCFVSYKMLSEYGESKEYKTSSEFDEYKAKLSKEHDAKKRVVKDDHCHNWCPCCDGHYGCCCEKDGCERCYNCQCSYCSKQDESKDDELLIKLKFKKVLKELNKDINRDPMCYIQ